MTTVTIRAARADDEAAVSELCPDVLQPADVVDDEGLAQLLWRTPGVSAFVAEASGSVIGAAFGTVIPETDATLAGAITLLAVDPGHAHQGVGRALLEELERRLGDLGATEIWTGGGQPRFWWPGIDATETATITFFENAGYVEDDRVDNMRVALAEADLAARPRADVSIRRLTAEEWPSFLSWMETAWEDPWGTEVETTLHRSPVSCFVAERNGSYLGFAAYATNRHSWFGPMGSSPEARGSGLGSELLRLCLRDYVEQGLTECEIGWVGPVAFYEKAVGAAVWRTFVRLRKPLLARP